MPGDHPGGSSISAESDDKDYVSSRASAATDDIKNPGNFVADEDLSQVLAQFEETSKLYRITLFTLLLPTPCTSNSSSYHNEHQSTLLHSDAKSLNCQSEEFRAYLLRNNVLTKYVGSAPRAREAGAVDVVAPQVVEQVEYPQRQVQRRALDNSLYARRQIAAQRPSQQRCKLEDSLCIQQHFAARHRSSHWRYLDASFVLRVFGDSLCASNRRPGEQLSGLAPGTSQRPRRAQVPGCTAAKRHECAPEVGPTADGREFQGEEARGRAFEAARRGQGGSVCIILKRY